MKLIYGVVPVAIITSFGWWLWGDNFDPIVSSTPSATTETKIKDRTVSVAIGETL